MDRFSQLEFDDRKKPKLSGGEGEPIRDAEYFLKEALRCWLNGDFELALRNYSRVLEKDNVCFEAWSGQILMLIELGEYKEAVVWADKALEIYREHPELLALKASTLARDAKYKEAIAYSDNSIGKSDITPRVWLARADILLSEKSPVAEECIRKATNIAGPKIAIIKLEAGRLLSRKGLFSAAIEYLNEAVSSLPKSSLAWYELGYCQARLRLSQARVSLQQSINICPDCNPATKLLEYIEGKRFLSKISFRRFRG